MSGFPPLADLLVGLAAVLDGHGTPWYVFRAQAVLVWGRPRFTADVDVTVQVAPDGVAPLLRDLERGGFRLRVSDTADLVRQTRLVPLLHLASHLPVDVSSWPDPGSRRSSCTVPCAATSVPPAFRSSARRTS